MTSVQRIVVLLLCVASASGCGGGGAPGSTTPARTSNGNVVRTAGGDAVSAEAHAQWRTALETFQRHETANAWNEGLCTSVSEDFAEAAEAQGGNFAEALYMAGLSLDRCNKDAESLAFYNRALQANARFCRARVAVGVRHLNAGRNQEAAATFRQAIEGDAQCTEGYVNLAILQRQNIGGDSREALNNLRRALAVDAQFVAAFNQMALLYLAQAQNNAQMLDLAEVVCRQAQQINRDYAAIYNTWGLINVRQGNIIAALAKFERAFTLDPRMFEALMNFGQITLGFRGYEDAKRAFQRAVELQPRNYDAHIGLGAALRGLNDRDGARAQYEAAREIDANRPEAYFNLGILYQDYMGGAVAELQRAKEFYQQFLAKAGNDARYSASVEAIRRTCQQQAGRRRRGAAASQCRPGRMQNLDTAIQGMQLMQEAAQQQQAPTAPPTPPAQ